MKKLVAKTVMCFMWYIGAIFWQEIAVGVHYSQASYKVFGVISAILFLIAIVATINVIRSIKNVIEAYDMNGGKLWFNC